MAYLKNTWYMAAWLDEIPGQGGLARTLLDEPVFIYRDSQGEVRALFDRCPHRFAPLSKGTIDGDAIVCGYHGLAFDGAGKCVRNPHGPVTDALNVRSYPVAEAHRALWIWMGNADLANRELIPDLSFLVLARDSAFNNGYIYGNGHYQLYVDNILDLSHIDYLHPDTLGGSAISRTRGKVKEHDSGVISINWDFHDDHPTPVLAQFLPPGTDRVDSWLGVDWSAPAVMMLVNGAVPVGEPREKGVTAYNVHIMTPETVSSTHYFFASTRDFGVDDQVLNEKIRTIREQIFATEDEPMIAAQHERIGDADFWSLKPALFRTDEGAVKVRRRMDALIRAESVAS